MTSQFPNYKPIQSLPKGEAGIKPAGIKPTATMLESVVVIVT